MIPDEKLQQATGWRKKFLANRMALESILFEKELTDQKAPVKTNSGLLVLLALFLFHAALLTQAVFRGGGNFPAQDAMVFHTALQYAQAVDAGEFVRLFKPETFAAGAFKAPFYYLSFYPALKLFPGSPRLVLSVVNSFFLLAIMLSVFYAVRKGRGNRSGWFAASLAASFPFVISMGRHASPDIALSAVVAAVYCCYINCEGFEKARWSALFAVVFPLGFLTGTTFAFYILPLFVEVLNGILSPMARKYTRLLTVLVLVFCVPWYFRNAVFTFLRGLFLNNDLVAALGIGSFSPLNLLRDLALLLDALHPLLLLLGGVSLAWLCISIFMAYEEKELLVSWLLIPYCAFALFSAAGGGNLYPALLPLAVAAGIMMPGIAGKPLLIGTLALALVYQSGFVPAAHATVAGRRVSLFGMDLVRNSDLRTQDALAAIRAAAGGKPVRVQLVGDGPYFNPESLELLARGLGYDGMRFVRYPRDFMGLADFVLYKTAAFSAAHADGQLKGYSDEISSPGGWFSSVFREAASYEMADTSKLLVYARSAASAAVMEPGAHMFPKFSLGGETLEDVVAEVGEFDPGAGAYKSLEIFIPHLNYRGADLYSTRFRFENVSLFPLAEDFSAVRLTGCESLRILSLKLREATVNDLLKAGAPEFRNLEVKLDNGLAVQGTYRNVRVDLGFSVVPTGSGFKLKLTRMELGGIREALLADTGDDYQEEAAPEQGEAAANEAAAAGDQGKMPGATDLSQYYGDKAVSDAVKTANPQKMLQQAFSAQKKGLAPAPRRAPAAAPAARGGLVSDLLVKLFSMDLSLLDENSMPFKVRAGKVSIKRGLLALY